MPPSSTMSSPLSAPPSPSKSPDPLAPGSTTASRRSSRARNQTPTPTQPASTSDSADELNLISPRKPTPSAAPQAQTRLKLVRKRPSDVFDDEARPSSAPLADDADLEASKPSPAATKRQIIKLKSKGRVSAADVASSGAAAAPLHSTPPPQRQAGRQSRLATPSGAGADKPALNTPSVPAKDVAPGSSATWANHIPPQIGGKGQVPRNVAVKRYDGEPLLRADLQHSVLTHLFNDTTRCFTNPRPGQKGPPGSKTWRCPTPVYPYGQSNLTARRSDETPEEYAAWKERFDAWDKVKDKDAEALEAEGWPAPGSEKLTFKELYLENLLHAGKCTQAMRTKVLQDHEYAEDFAKACFLVNIGRINTTLAFYPEMKTILRSYHPLPSIQRNENTQRHMQDAPRMKSLLKSCLLDFEKPAPSPGQNPDKPSAGKPAKGAAAAPKPATGNDDGLVDLPQDLLELVSRREHQPSISPDYIRPATGVVQAIFALFNRAQELSALHFDHPHDFYALFFPHEDYPIPSLQRARAFLWLLWHYLEGGAGVPGKQHEGLGASEKAVNPFEDARTAAARLDVRQTWEGLDEASKEAVVKEGYWKGIKNPAWAEWDAARHEHEAKVREREIRKQKEDAAAFAAKVKTEGTDGDGDTEMRDAAPAEHKSAVDAEDDVPDLGPEPPQYLHRYLAPRLDVISIAESARENEDPEKEFAWGAAMRVERSNFLIRFQKEEQAKANAAAAAGDGTLEEGEEAVAVAAAVAGEGKKAKKRASIPAASASTYPLAKILAAAKDNANPTGPMPSPAPSGAEPGTTATGSRKKAKAAPRAGSAASPEEADVPAMIGADESVKAVSAAPREPSPPLELWTLDLSIPAPPNGQARNRNQSAAAAVAAAAAAQSLPRTAWRRILERAQRGVGDASYDSDDEGVANDEGRDERPRGEVARILGSIRVVRTHRGDIKPPKRFEGVIDLEGEMA